MNDIMRKDLVSNDLVSNMPGWITRYDFNSTQIYQIALPTPFMVGDVNVYLVVPNASPDNIFLIDTGTLWTHFQYDELKRKVKQNKVRRASLAQKRIEEYVNKIRRVDNFAPDLLAYYVFCDALKEINVRRENIRGIFLTHTHPDHCSLASKIQAESRARVYIHHHGRGRIENWLKECEEENKREAEILKKAGMQELAQMVASSGQHFNRGVGNITEGIQTFSESFDESTACFTDGVKINVTHVPGHSVDSVLYQVYDGEHNVAFVGDLLIDGMSPIPFCSAMAPPSLKRYLGPETLEESLESAGRILAGTKLVLSGHRGVITNVGAYISFVKRTHEDRRKKILAYCSEAKRSVAEIMEGAGLYNGDLDAFNKILAALETTGHAELLVEQGKLKMLDDQAKKIDDFESYDGVVYYREI